MSKVRGEFEALDSPGTPCREVHERHARGLGCALTMLLRKSDPRGGRCRLPRCHIETV